MSNKEITAFEPKALWQEFENISRIPRGSGNEKGIRAYIIDSAKEAGCEIREDEVGNIVVLVKGSKGRENSPVVVLQGHMDMVCEKNRETVHDFEKDPIKLVVDGEWLRADGTTLGADNGIAVAMMMALIKDSGIDHGPLECLFTVDEETALTGALGLDPEMITGRTLLNLDSEEEGIFYIGCAGGINTEGRVPLSMEVVGDNWSCLEIGITGLKGGHSGADVHQERGNSVVIGGRILKALSEKMGVRIIGIDGGDKHNAIPREFFATLVATDVSAVKAEVEKLEAVIREELGDREPNFALSMNDLGTKGGVALTEESQSRVLNLMRSMTHGVMSMSQDIPGLVHSSTNFASVKTDETECFVLTSQRSARDSEARALADRVASLIDLAGGKHVYASAYPGWVPDLSSPLLAKCLTAWKSLREEEPRVTAIHAGLECGVIGSKIPGIDMISIGPDLVDVHTPDERLNIQSTFRMWNFLLQLLILV